MRHFFAHQLLRILIVLLVLSKQLKVEVANMFAMLFMWYKIQKKDYCKLKSL